MKGVLVVVPCGQGKVWDKNPHAGPTRACDVYTGAPFNVNRGYAEHFAERWIILSAKYGLILPDFTIPSSYNVTFKRASTRQISLSILRDQAKRQHLDLFPLVVGLGGKEYRAAVKEAFASSQVVFPFAGLPIGRAMSATKRAVELGKLSP